MNQAVIGIGSNVEAERNIPDALDRLSDAFSLLAESRFRRTDPVGPPGQPEFVNGAVFIETGLGRDALKAELLRIEAAMGRVRGEDKYAPRPIDLDIVVWNGVVVDEDFRSRAFLREAVAEVLPVLPRPDATTGDGRG